MKGRYIMFGLLRPMGLVALTALAVPALAQDNGAATAADVEEMSQKAASFRRIIATLEREAEAARAALEETKAEVQGAKDELANVTARVEDLVKREGSVRDEADKAAAQRDAAQQAFEEVMGAFAG